MHSDKIIIAGGLRSLGAAVAAAATGLLASGIGDDIIRPASVPAPGFGAKRAAARLAATAKAETARLAGVTEPDQPSRQVMRRVMRKATKRRMAADRHQAIANRRLAVQR